MYGVWYGMVWCIVYGMVWCMVWYGMVYGMVWYGMYSIVLYCIVCNGWKDGLMNVMCAIVGHLN